MEFPALHAPVFHTEDGTPYLREPGVALLAQTAFNPEGLRGFLEGFDPSLQFSEYLKDDWTGLQGGDAIAKVAGQLCYMAFGPGRTRNDQAGKYLDRIKQEQHGSVCEHANFSFLVYGIDRAVSHELVRHRAGLGFSQCSQRYTGPKTLRFVEPAEMQDNEELHAIFLEDIQDTRRRYERRVAKLIEKQGHNVQLLSGESKTELRKKVNQCARRVLTNETEAPMIVTANARAWRHVSEMRASKHADVAIRSMAMKAFQVVKQVAPLLFSDYEVEELPDGSTALDTKFRKV